MPQLIVLSFLFIILVQFVTVQESPNDVGGCDRASSLVKVLMQTNMTDRHC